MTTTVSKDKLEAVSKRDSRLSLEATQLSQSLDRVKKESWRNKAQQLAEAP
jgi:hypothetical protein